MNSLLSSAAAALPQIKRGAHTFEWKVVETSVRCWSIALVPWVPMEIVHRSSGARRNFLGRRTAAGGRLRTTPGSSVGEERLRGQKFSAASLGAMPRCILAVYTSYKQYLTVRTRERPPVRVPLPCAI